MKPILFFVGIIFCSISIFFCIIYLNLLTIGYNFSEYVNFISRRIECINALVGIILICLTIFVKGGDKNELHL